MVHYLNHLTIFSRPLSNRTKKKICRKRTNNTKRKREIGKGDNDEQQKEREWKERNKWTFDRRQWTNFLFRLHVSLFVIERRICESIRWNFQSDRENKIFVYFQRWIELSTKSIELSALDFDASRKWSFIWSSIWAGENEIMTEQGFLRRWSNIFREREKTIFIGERR